MADSDNLRAKVKEDVIRIMSETLEISPEEITSELQFNTDLPFDSLQLYEFVIDVEETYNIRLPDELILYSPWVDISMENEEIKEYIPREPLLEAGTIWPAAKGWAADLDLHDPLVSPIYGDLKGLRNVTVFLGTEEILYPDVTKMFHMLDADVSNELIVGEEIFHCYPLAPIEEAKPACRKIFHIVMR